VANSIGQAAHSASRSSRYAVPARRAGLANPAPEAASKRCRAKAYAVADEEQLEQLRSALARAYEKRQPFALRLIQAVRDRMSASTQEKPIILTLQIEKKKEDAA
jgi:hypothetical protein